MEISTNPSPFTSHEPVGVVVWGGSRSYLGNLTVDAVLAFEGTAIFVRNKPSAY